MPTKSIYKSRMPFNGGYVFFVVVVRVGNRQGGWKMRYNCQMKTKPLTFLLARTFPISGFTTVNAKKILVTMKELSTSEITMVTSITFNLPNFYHIIGKKIWVRINVIDTPEIKGKCNKEKYDAEQAREMVGDILKDAERITLKNMQRGSYFRIASDVIFDGESLGVY
jgi:endonuclease YncB( thermonuclease family)